MLAYVVWYKCADVAEDRANVFFDSSVNFYPTAWRHISEDGMLRCKTSQQLKHYAADSTSYCNVICSHCEIAEYQGGLVLALQCLGSPGSSNPEETCLPGLPLSWSPILFSGSGPVGLPAVIWTEKNNWKFAIFRPTRRSLLPRRPGWTDNILNFFEWLAKVRATGQDVYWASWGVFWINSEFARCSLLPSQLG